MDPGTFRTAVVALVVVLGAVGLADPSSAVADPPRRPQAPPADDAENKCGWVTCTYYFDKSQTRDLSRAQGAAAGCALLVGIPAAAGVCAVAWTSVALQADRAHQRHMCLKIKYTKSMPPVWWPDIYRGARCR